jgi:hypothetical protein
MTSQPSGVEICSTSRRTAGLLSTTKMVEAT